MSENNKAIKVYKRLGETPLERLERLREERPEFKEKKLSYAGRLDPMAEGVMLILVGGANKDREKYLELAKVYTFEILFGLSSDSHDILGVIERDAEIKKISKKDLIKALNELTGKRVQKYPAYSSRTVKGKALHQWAREGRISEIEIPEHEVEIYSLKLDELKRVDSAEIRKTIFNKINKVKGDFRQKEILDSWDSALGLKKERFEVALIEAHVSSGTYIRVLCREIGDKLGVGALAYSIKREDIITA